MRVNFAKSIQNLVTPEADEQHTTWTDYALEIPTKVLASPSDSPLFISFSYAYDVKSILLSQPADINSRFL